VKVKRGYCTSTSQSEEEPVNEQQEIIAVKEKRKTSLFALLDQVSPRLDR